MSKEKHISARLISGVLKAECKTWKHHSDFLKLWYSCIINIYAIIMDISLAIVRYVFQLPLINEHFVFYIFRVLLSN